MPRVKRGTLVKKRHKRILKSAKGYKGAKSRLFRQAKENVRHALNYAYRDRRRKKREIRNLWIIRINAGARALGLSYSKMMAGLKKANIMINRKILAELAVNNQNDFNKLAKIAQENLGASKPR